MRNNKTASLFPKKLVIESLKQSFIKLNPRMMFRNPIMFIVEVVTFVMLFVTIWALPPVIRHKDLSVTIS